MREKFEGVRYKFKVGNENSVKWPQSFELLRGTWVLFFLFKCTPGMHNIRPAVQMWPTEAFNLALKAPNFLYFASFFDKNTLWMCYNLLTLFTTQFFIGLPPDFKLKQFFFYCNHSNTGRKWFKNNDLLCSSYVLFKSKMHSVKVKVKHYFDAPFKHSSLKSWYTLPKCNYLNLWKAL